MILFYNFFASIGEGKLDFFAKEGKSSLFAHIYVLLKEKMEVLIQVDLGQEETKFGVLEGELVKLVHRVGEMENLSLKGFMIMPPFFPNPEDVRPYFRRLRQLLDQLNRKGVGSEELKELSMGMSHDFEVAIEEGATMVRMGTAIFGPREE